MRTALLCAAPAELRVAHVAVAPERITVIARACRAAVRGAGAAPGACMRGMSARSPGAPGAPPWERRITRGWQTTALASRRRLTRWLPNAPDRPVTHGGVNTLAESVIGPFETEMIRRRGPWPGFDGVEYATLEWVA